MGNKRMKKYCIKVIAAGFAVLSTSFILIGICAQAAWDFESVDITDKVYVTRERMGYKFIPDYTGTDNIIYKFYGNKYSKGSGRIITPNGEVREGVWDSSDKGMTLESGYIVKAYDIGNDKTYGIIDKNGNIILEPEYESVNFTDGRAIVKKIGEANHFYEIDIYGRLLREFDFDADTVYSFADMYAVAKKGNEFSILDEELNIIIPYSDTLHTSWTRLYNGYIAVYDTLGNHNLMDIYGNTVTALDKASDIRIPDEDGMCMLRKGALWDHFSDREYGWLNIKTLRSYTWYNFADKDNSGMHRVTTGEPMNNSIYIADSGEFFCGGRNFQSVFKIECGYIAEYYDGHILYTYEMMDNLGNKIKDMEPDFDKCYGERFYTLKDSEHNICVKSYDGTVDTGYIYSFVSATDRYDNVDCSFNLHPYISCKKSDGTNEYDYFLIDIGEQYKPEPGAEVKCASSNGSFMHKLSDGRTIYKLHDDYYIANQNGIITAAGLSEDAAKEVIKLNSIYSETDGGIITYYDKDKKLFDAVTEGLMHDKIRSAGLPDDGVIEIRYDGISDYNRKENGGFNVNEGADYYDTAWCSIFSKRYKTVWKINRKTYVVEDYDGNTFILKAKEDYAAIRVNGISVKTDQCAVVRDGRTLVPMRSIVEALNGEVQWDEKTQTASARLNGKDIKFTINSYRFTVDNVTYDLDVPAQLINDRTMLPVRALSEAAGAKVSWNQQARLVMIDTEKDNSLICP